MNNTPKVTCDRLNPAKAVSFGASCEAVINLKGRMRSGKREGSYVGFHTATAESEAGKQPSEAVNTAVFPLRFRFAGRLRAVIGPLCSFPQPIVPFPTFTPHTHVLSL